MTDLNAKVLADLKRELAEAKAEANRVTESMGSEIVRLHGEIDHQRTRAEAAEQELRAEKERGNSAWDDGYAKSSSRAKVAEAKLAAIRAHLAGVDAKTVLAMLDAERSRPTLSGIAKEGPVHALDHLARADLAKINGRLGVYAPALLAAAREALEP